MTDLIKLPKKLLVGGVTYKVLYPYEFNDAREIIGLHSGLGGWIRVGSLKGRVTGHRDNQSILSVFLHELLHAVDFIYCGDNIKEDEIEILTRAFYQVMADNDLHIDNSGMPDNIRICGANFEVVQHYEYEDASDTTSHLDYDSYRIFIADNLNGVEFSEQFKKLTFLFTLVHAILFKYMSNKEMEDFTNKVSVRAFANGLYQVVHDNKIEELFDKWIKKR